MIENFGIGIDISNIEKFKKKPFKKNETFSLILDKFINSNKLKYEIFENLLKTTYKNNPYPIRLLGVGIIFDNNEKKQLFLNMLLPMKTIQIII